VSEWQISDKEVALPQKSTRVLILSALLALTVFGQSVDTGKTWREFIEWVRTQPRISMQDYRATLTGRGLTAAQAEETVALIGKLYHENPRYKQELDALGYNKLYADPAPPKFTLAPNAFLVAVTRDLKPGKALDIAIGQGRNAVYLATQGWDVTGFDIAEEGLRAAARNAAAAGARITTVQAGFEDFDYGKERWDLITLIYTDAPQIDPKYVARIVAALKPGGLLVYERPMRSLSNPEPYWPETELDKKNSLLNAWSDLQIVSYQDDLGIADWQQTAEKRLEHKLRIVRLLARKL
jgi:SAM-dependent methyltransferase